MARQDIYEHIAHQLADLMERGVAPWRRPWKGGGLPSNASTGRSYSGINVWVLFVAATVRGYADPRWLTFRQAKALGGHVRKGEKGTKIVVMKRVERKRELRDGEEREYLLVRSATVFNVAQCEGLDLGEVEPQAFEPVERAEEIASSYLAAGPTLASGLSAYYAPADDRVVMPPRESFVSPAAYYSTLFHELGHSTGHESRLARDLGGLRGDHRYSREELVAEFTAAYLRATAGIEDDQELEQSAAYLRGWAAKIRDEPMVLTWAAARAQQAAEAILAPCSAEVTALAA